MNPRLRGILDQIDEVLAEESTTSGALWDVLTALRGPDWEESDQVKDSATVPIRVAAFPRTAQATRDRRSAYANRALFSCYGGKFDSTIVPDGLNHAVIGSHFQGHIDAAASALDLRDS